MHTPIRLRLVVVVAMTVGLGLTPITLAASAATRVHPPAFPVGNQLAAPFPYGLTQAEPNIKSDLNGELYVMAPASTPIGCELWTLPPGGTGAETFRGAPDGGAGGGDCDIALSPTVPKGQTQQTLAYASLTLPDITVGSSTDGAQTFSPPNPVGSLIVGDDRQWLAAAGANTFYLSTHILASDNIAVSKSTDGGKTYLPTGVAIDAAHLPQAAYNNELGPLVVDTTSSLGTKPVYTIFSAPSTVEANTNTVVGTTQSSNNALYLASSYDGGVTWVDTPIYIAPTTSTVDHIFPTLSIDRGGVLWVAWSDNSHVFVSHVATHGVTGLPQSLSWSAPAQLDQTGTNIFAWVAGGGSGRADVVWYSGSGVGPDDPSNQWVVRFAQLQATKKGLSVAQTQASDHVMHVGQICETGVTCGINGNRDLLDFLEVTVTPDGRGAIAWSDDTASPPAAQIYVAEQCDGVSALTGERLHSTC